MARRQLRVAHSAVRRRRRARKVEPRPADAGIFVTEGEKGHAFALRIFDRIKVYCGMADWEADLVADDNPLADDASLALAMIAPQKHAVGTFGVAGNRIVISYVPALLKRPDHLIATLAHELAHYLLATARESPPCEKEEREFLTDVTAVYLGFGVFLANARFRFEALQSGAMHGWRIAHSGYLPEADLIFALALFLQAKSLNPDLALACLKPHLAAMLRRALRDLQIAARSPHPSSKRCRRGRNRRRPGLSKAIRDEVCRRLATLGLRCAHPRSAFDLVATGLDPVVRAAMTQQSRSSTCEPLLSMGCQVKSGNDDIRDQTIPPPLALTSCGDACWRFLLRGANGSGPKVARPHASTHYR